MSDSGQLTKEFPVIPGRERSFVSPKLHRLVRGVIPIAMLERKTVPLKEIIQVINRAWRSKALTNRAGSGKAVR